MIAETGRVRTGGTLVYMLQWGRDHMIAETLARPVAAWRPVASMGPRSYDRGNKHRPAIVNLIQQASMGPRSYDRGNEAASRGQGRHRQASMGPRSYDRGNVGKFNRFAVSEPG